MFQRAFARARGRRRQTELSKRAPRRHAAVASLLPEPLERRVLMTMSVDVYVVGALTSIPEGGEVSFTFALTGADPGDARNIAVDYTFTYDEDDPHTAWATPADVDASLADHTGRSGSTRCP